MYQLLRRDAPESPSPPVEGKLSLILPAHNEKDSLETVVQSSVSVLNEYVPDWEIIIVDDGSTDGSADIADALAAADARVSAVHHPHNQGYGSAWRSGFSAAAGEYIMCMDSDGQFDLGDITKLLPYVNHCDIVAGYRLERKDPPHRKLNAMIFHLAVRVMFNVKLHDLDCAFKIFRASLIHSLPLRSPGALINLEIYTLSRLKCARVVEVGVNHYPRRAGEPTGAKPAVVLQAMLEIFVLRLRVWREGFKASSAVPLALGIGAGLTLLTAVARRIRRR